jgi:LacI family transcriptional regulator
MRRAAKKSISPSSRPPAPNRLGRARPKVALIVETSLASGRDILRGIAQYIREHGPWSVYHEPRGLEEDVPRWLARWRGDGIIARVQTRQIAEAVLATGLPVVDVLGLVPEAGLPLVHVDDRAIAELAAEHLLERGFQEFGFVGITGAPWAEGRRQAFEAAVQRAGFRCHSCILPPDARRYESWEKQIERLIQWLQELPRPIGIMVCNDPRGELVMEACRRVDVAVPEQAAIIGVDNDEPLCEVCNPPLSSVMPDHRRVGYEGAALLDRLMAGQPPPKEPIYIPPVGIVARQSTDVLAVADSVVAQALHFIREYACDGINTEDILQHVPVSRSTLQRRFRAILGRTVHDEILRIRLRRVCELLARSDLPIDVVSDKAGFTHRQYLGAVFKQKMGMTLAEYRRQMRRQ